MQTSARKRAEQLFAEFTKGAASTDEPRDHTETDDKPAPAKKANVSGPRTLHLPTASRQTASRPTNPGISALTGK